MDCETRQRAYVKPTSSCFAPPPPIGYMHIAQHVPGSTITSSLLCGVLSRAGSACGLCDANISSSPSRLPLRQHSHHTRIILTTERQSSLLISM